MKKTYIAPSTEITMTEVCQLIADSGIKKGEGEGSHVGEARSQSDWDIWADDESED